MATVTVYTRDWWSQVKTKASPKYLNDMSESCFTVNLECNTKFSKKLKGDALLRDKFEQAVSEKFKNFIKLATLKVKDTEKKLDGIAEKCLRNLKTMDIDEFKTSWDKHKSTHELAMKSMAATVESQIEKAILETFNKFKKLHKEYAAYTFRVKAKIGIAIGKVGFAVAKLVSTQGSDVLAWRGLVKSSIKAGTEMVKFCRSAEAHRAKIQKNLNTVKSWNSIIAKKRKELVTAKEVGLAFLKVAIGTDCGVTLDALKSDLGQYKSKMDGLELKAHSTAEKLDAALEAMDKAKTKLPPAQGEDTLAPLEKQVGELIAKISSLLKDVGTGRDWAGETLEEVEKMQSEANVTNVGTMVKVLDTAYDTVSSVQTWVKFAESGDKLAQSVMKQAVVAAGVIERWEKDVRKMKVS